MIYVSHLEKKEVFKYFNNYKIVNLENCDYTNENYDFVVERKKDFDLINSILNNHVYDQLQRMREEYPDKPQYLVFEGDFDALVKCQHNKGIQMMLKVFPYKLTYLYGVQFVQTWSIIETVQFIELLDKYAKTFKGKTYYPKVHIKGTDSRIRNLITIPQISQSKAEVLLKKYGTINNIIEQCKTNPKEVMSLEGIGKKSVENILSIYCGDGIKIKKGKRMNHVVQRENYKRNRSKRNYI